MFFSIPNGPSTGLGQVRKDSTPGATQKPWHLDHDVDFEVRSGEAWKKVLLERKRSKCLECWIGWKG